MRFSGFSIDGFGLFHDVTLRNLPHGLVLFRGNNEAGKTTFLGFLRAILFGFPDGRSRENAYSPLAGGQHGGRVTIGSDRLGDVVVERRPGKGGGAVTVSFSDGRKGGGEDLRQLLGHTTRDLFRNVYAFSLSELTALDSLDNDAVKGALYGASAGAAMQALPKAQKIIDEQLASLFAARGRNPRLNALFGTLDHLGKELREAMKGIDEYDEAYRRLLEADQAIEQRQAQGRVIRADRDRAATYLKLWDDWIQLQDLEGALQETVKIESFPEDGVLRLDRETNRLQNTRETLTGLQAQLADLQRKVAEQIVDERLLAHEERIRVLIDRRGGYDAALKSLPLSRQAHESKEREIRNLLATLGKEWTEERVSCADMSLFTRDAVRKHQERLHAAGIARAKAEVVKEQRLADLDQARTEEKLTQARLDQCSNHGEEMDESALDGIRKGRNQFADIIHDLPQRNGDLARAEEELAQTIREIDPGWGESHINSLDCSVPAQEAVQSHEATLSQARADLDQAQTMLVTAEEQCKAARDERDGRVRELAKLPSLPVDTREELTERKSQLRRLRALASARERAVLEIRYVEERLSDRRRELGEPSPADAPIPRGLPRWSPLVSAALFCLGALMLVFQGSRLAGAVVIAAGVTLFLLYRRTEYRGHVLAAKAHAPRENLTQAIAGIEAHLSELRKQQAAMDKDISQLCDRLGIAGQVTDEQIDESDREADKLLSALDARLRAEGDIENLNERVTRAERAVEAARRRRTECEEALQATERAWDEKVRSLDLKPGTQARTVLLIFKKAETAKAQARAVHDLEGRIRNMERAKDKYLALTRAVPTFAAALEGGLSEVLSAVDTFLDQSKQRAKEMEQRKLAEQALTEKKRHRQDIETAVQVAQEAFESKIELEAQVKGRWQTWLQQMGLGTDLAPETALEALKRIEDVSRLLGERSILRQVIDREEHEIREYGDLLAETFAALERAVPEMDRRLASVDLLSEELQSSKTGLDRRKQLEDQEPGVQARITATEKLVRETKERIGTLLAAGGATDEEMFRTRGASYVRSQSLLAGISQCQANLKKISGDEDIVALRAKLSSTTKEQVQSSLDESAQGLEDVEAELDELRQARADLNDRLQKLASAEDISHLRADEEKVREEIRLAATEWGRHAIAKFLIGKARERFEQEQQPKVLQDASKFLSKITDGAHERVLCPIGENTFEVIAANGDRKQPDVLSRGTAEQLYLAIRFGYILNYAANGEPLPVVMDDILVNFDPDRARHAAEAVVELAKTHQVLYLTCHPETIEVFRGVRAQFSVYQIEDSRVALA